MKKIIFLSFILSLISSIALADNININPVVVTGNREPQKLSNVMTSVSVITKEDIEREQPQDIGTILQNEPGIEVVRSGGLGAQTSIFMRGSESHSVLVLVDGLPFSDQVNNTIQLENIPISLVDKIEILRGNASALYGPGAAGGVIQIFTKNSLNTGAYGSISYGSRNTQNYVSGYGGKFNDTTFNISVNHQQTDGFATLNPNQNYSDGSSGGNISNPTKNVFYSNNLSANIVQMIRPGHEIGFKILASELNSTIDASSNINELPPYTNSPAGPNGGSAYSYDYLEEQNSKNILSQIYLKDAINNSWNSEITLGSSNIVTRTNWNSYDITGVPLSFFTTHQNNLNWVNNFILNQNQTILLGFQTQQTKAFSSNAYFGESPFQAERSLNSIFSGYTGKFDQVGVQMNARYDATNTGQSSASGLGGVSYDLTDHLKIAGNISNAFVLPTPYQLDSGAAMGGNKNLMPELDKSQEISLQYSDSHSLIRAVIFNRDTKNLIAAGTNYAPGCTSEMIGLGECSHQLTNIAKAETNGMEFSAKTMINKITLKASATFQDPVNKTYDTQLIRRAKDFGSFEISYPIESYTIGSQIFLTSSTPDIPIYEPCPPGQISCVKNPGYSVTNLFVSYKYDNNWSAKLRVENLFNKSYETAYGYNTPGLGAFLTLQYSPGTSKETK